MNNIVTFLTLSDLGPFWKLPDGFERGLICILVWFLSLFIKYWRRLMIIGFPFYNNKVIYCE